MRVWSAVISAFFICGCASTHNFDTDGHSVFGGGYRQSKVADGIFEITAGTNWAPWENLSAARELWRGRAKELCGSDKYFEIEVTEGSFDQMPSIGLIRYIVTHRHGYAVCEGANMSEAKARQLIQRR